MRQFFKFFFAALAAIFTFCFLAFIILFAMAMIGASSGKSDATKSNSILVMDMNDAINEQSIENSFAAFSGGEGNSTGLNDIVNSIYAAKEDSKIKGIYIKLGMNPNGWATLFELRNALEDFKTSKKFIYAYGEICDQKSYYIGNVADSIFINPHGAMELKGLSIVGTFYKGAIDKMGIEATGFHCGKYKGAHEPFSFEKFSEANRFQLQTLLNEMDSVFINSVAQKSKKSFAEIKNMANNLTIKFPNDAVANKLIDGVRFGSEVDDLFRQKLNITDAKKKINFTSISNYSSDAESKYKGKDKIAILYAEGAIADGSGDDGIFSEDMVKQIRKIKNNDAVKAVVLRVNSPGGSALASEIIYNELMLLNKVKPITVSMGDYAASGGYYIACAGNKIFADPNTLTGSIGVVGILFNFENFMKNKLGVTTDAIKTGNFSDFPTVSRKMTDIEKQLVQSYLDSIYITFKTRVSKARNLSMDQVEELAQGHVYTGLLGKKLGLVDEIGGKDAAIKNAAAAAKLKDFGIVEYPKPVDQFEKLIKSLSGKESDDVIMKKIMGDDYKFVKSIKEARQKNNKIMAELPFDIEIK